MKMIVLPCCTRPRSTREEVVGLLRRQHRRRLVQDEDVGAAIEDFEDLDALLEADGQIAGAGVGVDRQPVARGRDRGSLALAFAVS